MATDDCCCQLLRSWPSQTEGYSLGRRGKDARRVALAALIGQDYGGHYIKGRVLWKIRCFMTL